MKVLIVDQGCVGGALALRMAQQDHEVFWFIEDKPENLSANTGQGLHPNIKRIDNFMPYLMKADLTIPTENGSFIEKLDAAKKRGAVVYSPSAEAVKLEIDRDAGMKFLADHGVKVPESKRFKSLDDVAAFIKKNEGPWVIKPAGDNDNKALSYVSSSDEEMLEQIQHWKERGEKFDGSILIQKKIEGYEMAVCAWVGRDGFVGPFSESFEHKKLMSSDYGPSTGEQGTVIKYVKESKLGEEVLRPLEEDLAEMGAFCSCDVNCIIDKEGNIHPLEFTMRNGWPATNLLLYLHDGDLAEALLGALNGEDHFEPNMDVGICVVLSIPDYPYGNYATDEPEKVIGLPIRGVDKDVEPHFQPQSVSKVKGKLVTSGDYVAVVCDSGKTVEKAQESVYELIKDIKIPDKIVRDDIGDRVIKALPELQKLGFATDWKIDLNKENK